MFMQNLTEEQRLTKAVVAIMSNPKYVHLASVLMIGKREIVEDYADGVSITAYTNGRDEFYGRNFVKLLNDAELRFLVLHEVYHKLYKHLHIWRHLYDENPQLANCANDYVINIKIADENTDKFATMTGALEKGCYDEKYRGMDSAQVYKLLCDEQQNDGGGRSKSGGAGDGGSETLPNGQAPFDQHDWEGAQEMDAEERRELARELDEAIRQGALVASKTGSGGDRDLEELLKPQVDWREVLREFVCNTCAGSDYSTYRKPNRRYIGMGIVMPSGNLCWLSTRLVLSGSVNSLRSCLRSKRSVIRYVLTVYVYFTGTHKFVVTRSITLASSMIWSSLPNQQGVVALT